MALAELSTQERKEDASLASEDYVVKTMPHILGKLDMTTTYLMAIFFIVNAVTAANGGAAAFTYLILGGVTFFIPCAIATAQLGYMFPHEGSLYNWTHKALGSYWSFFIGFCSWFPGVLVMVAGAATALGFCRDSIARGLSHPGNKGLLFSLFLHSPASCRCNAIEPCRT